MKIAFFTRSLPFHQPGGMEEITWALACGLVDVGHQVTVVTTVIPGRQHTFVENGVTIDSLEGTRPGAYSKAWWPVSREYYHKNRDRFDVVLGVSAGADSIAPLKDRAPVIRQCHGTSWGEIVTKIKVHSLRSIASLLLKSHGIFREIPVYRKYDAVVAVGDMVMKALNSPPTSYGVEPKTVHLIPNGISISKFSFSQTARDAVRQQYGFSEDAKVVLFLARLRKEKGIYEALDTFVKWKEKQPQAKMVIVGDGSEKAAVQKFISRQDLDDCIKMAGHVPRTEVEKYLSASDLFLFLTRRNEGLPLNILEALANGLPVICSNHISGVPECVEKVNPRDIDKVVDWVDKLLPERLQASSLPEENTMAYCVNQYLELFSALLEKNIESSEKTGSIK